MLRSTFVEVPWLFDETELTRWDDFGWLAGGVEGLLMVVAQLVAHTHRVLRDVNIDEYGEEQDVKAD